MLNGNINYDDEIVAHNRCNYPATQFIIEERNSRNEHELNIEHDSQEEDESEAQVEADVRQDEIDFDLSLNETTYDDTFRTCCSDQPLNVTITNESTDNVISDSATTEDSADSLNGNIDINDGIVAYNVCQYRTTQSVTASRNVELNEHELNIDFNSQEEEESQQVDTEVKQDKIDFQEIHSSFNHLQIESTTIGTTTNESTGSVISESTAIEDSDESLDVNNNYNDTDPPIGRQLVDDSPNRQLNENRSSNEYESPQQENESEEQEEAEAQHDRTNIQMSRAESPNLTGTDSTELLPIAGTSASATEATLLNEDNLESPRAGLLVWARIPKWPFWPAIVYPDNEGITTNGKLFEQIEFIE